MIQGMGGIMSITGFPDDEGGQPTKVGVGIADIMTGMYASSAILAALHARSRTGRGQHIDLALFDCQLAWLANQGLAYLTDGKEPVRLGNGHPTIVPYETFEAADGHFIIACGNDGQFARLCAILGAPHIAADPRFAKNVDRVRNRRELVPMINDLTRARPAADWLAACHAEKVPAGPVNSIPDAFADAQAAHRGMRISMPHPQDGRGAVDLIGNPIKFSDTPVSYRNAPPLAGQHTGVALADWLDLGEAELEALAAAGAIAGDAKP
jgi:crotonobetainyl-CoA:carnitine CoA-transferase CaiB-like acyl-CoA transferase